MNLNSLKIGEIKTPLGAVSVCITAFVAVFGISSMSRSAFSAAEWWIFLFIGLAGIFLFSINVFKVQTGQSLQDEYDKILVREHALVESSIKSNESVNKSLLTFMEIAERTGALGSLKKEIADKDDNRTNSDKNGEKLPNSEG